MTAHVVERLEPDRGRPHRVRPALGPSFALLGEVLLLGAVVAVLSIPVVTAVPALAAAVRHLRRFQAGEPAGAGAFLADLSRAVRELWWVGAGTVALLPLLALDLWLATSGALPGGALVAAVTGTLAVGVLVVVLRLTATWSAQGRAVQDLREAARASLQDPVGALLLLVALAVCVVLVVAVLPLLLVVGGLLALAALAVEHRRAATGRPA